jgi:uncharacterized protein
MHRIIVALAVVSAFLTSAPSAPAAEFGTREEAVAMVKRVQAKFKKDGYEATFRAINSGSKEFNDRDLYAFMVDFTGRNHANAVSPAISGKNIWDLKDQDGKFIVQEMIAVARDVGQGWFDYRWINPATKTIEDKSAYVERVGPDHFVGVGIYKNEQPNENTIGLISGSPNSDDTYLQMAYDLADVLNDDNLRVLPIAGIGGPRNIRDVRYLKGVDIGLTQTSILNNFRRSNERMGHIDNKIVYIAKLFNEEVHLVARSDITSVSQLKGRKVNLDAKGSGTSYSMRDLFRLMGIEVEEVALSQTDAFEKLRSGEIAATVLIAGKPVVSMGKVKPSDGFHFVSLPYSLPLMSDYVPTTFTHDDYPDMIPSGQSVDTIAVGAVLIAFNWPKTSTDRYRRVQKFVEAFFPRIAEFQKPPRHVKWREVNLAATLPGWTRFEPAQAWLDSKRNEELARGGPAAGGIGQNVASDGLTRAGVPGQARPQDDALFQEFLRWKQRQAR